MGLKLNGVFPPVPTLFDNDKLAIGRFAGYLSRLHDTGLAGYLVLGSNGEARLLSEKEKLDLIRVAWAEIPKDKVLLVGTGMESTAATVVFTRKAADLGADAALVLTPSFYRPADEGLRRHFEAVAEAAPIPILLYNMPKYTGMNLSLELIATLAAHPNIIGMKDSAGDIGQLVAIQEKVPDDFQLLLGSDRVFFAGLVYGIRGAILALANVAPRECVALYEAALEGNWQGARSLAARLAPVGRTVIGTYGVPGLKAALDLLGSAGGAPRLPLVSLGEAARKEIHDVLVQAGLL